MISNIPGGAEHPLVLRPRQAAVLLQLSPSTLAKRRLTGEGPTFCKLGRSVVYRMSDLTKWLDNQARRSTSDEGRATDK